MKLRKIATATVLSSGLLLGSLATASADETSTTTTATSTFTADLAAFKVAMTQYRSDLLSQQISYRAAMDKYRSDWASAVQRNLGSWQIAIEQWQQARSAWAAKIAPLAAAFKAAVTKADADYLVAKAIATTQVQQEAAIAAHKTAIASARTTFKSAVTALGTPPVKPTKPTELTKPAAPVKPVPPVKPVAPVKPQRS